MTATTGGLFFRGHSHIQELLRICPQEICSGLPYSAYGRDLYVRFLHRSTFFNLQQINSCYGKCMDLFQILPIDLKERDVQIKSVKSPLYSLYKTLSLRPGVWRLTGSRIVSPWGWGSRIVSPWGCQSRIVSPWGWESRVVSPWG